MSRIALVAYGSDGDLLPVGRVAEGLVHAGHQVRLCGPPEHAGRFDEGPVDYRAFGASVRAWFEPAFSMRSPTKQLEFFRFLRAQIACQLDELPTLVEGSDLVVGCSLVWGAPTVADQLGLPFLFMTFCPAYLPSPDHPPPLVPVSGLPRGVNRALWRSGERVVERLLGGPVTEARARWGLPRLPSLHRHLLGEAVILACDEALAPRPEVRGTPVHQTGYPGSLPPEPLPEPVEAFLDAGAPPVFVGFGSMNAAAPRERAEAMVAAARQVGARLVLQRGWAGLEADGAEDVLVVGELSHTSLFPRVHAVVHHGGAGTTATAARAGVPQVVVPHMLDQDYWARRVVEVGLGVVLPHGRLDRGPAATALDQVLSDPSFTATARRVAGELGGDPVAGIVELIENRSREGA